MKGLSLSEAVLFEELPARLVDCVDCDPVANVWFGKRACPPVGCTDMESIKGLIICPNGLKEKATGPHLAIYMLYTWIIKYFIELYCPFQISSHQNQLELSYDVTKKL